MKAITVPFKTTGFFSKTMTDYLDRNPKTTPFYHRFPELANFRAQIDEKQASFSPDTRAVLVKALEGQYQTTTVSAATREHLSKLANPTTFTVTTGHQLNLFTGPLYFLYKIINAINLAEELAQQFPEYHFVPVYWMATEDHDFEEINYFNFKGKKVTWNTGQTGPVGRFSTEGLDEVASIFAEHLGTSKNARALKELFHKAYAEKATLAEATRFLANELFGEEGLVIVDGDDSALKGLFRPYVQDELEQQLSHHKVQETIAALEASYKVQVNPREINLFFIKNGLRERIVLEENVYRVLHTDWRWNKEELLAHLEAHPEDFSPNVIMRPLYQEVILPNLCYIGGGGELAYWFQLKAYFEAVGVPFPMLLLRNSVQVMTQKQEEKLQKLNISTEELFLNQHELVKKKVEEQAVVCYDFAQQRATLQEQFATLAQLAKQTDVSFVGAVEAQEKKQLKGLAMLEKRMLRAEKRNQSDRVQRIQNIQDALLPNQSLEERQRNFSEYYLAYGPEFISTLKKELAPLSLAFTVLVLE